MNTKLYEHDGQKFQFNDHVIMECTFGVPDEKRSGRLVQVRTKVGSFGSDLYFLRLRDGSLITWENAMMRHVGDKAFEDAFYRSNGKQPPVVPEQPIDPADSVDEVYSIGDKYPAIGFVVDNAPQQPSKAQAFSIAVISPK